jgi:hypothetical protein
VARSKECLSALEAERRGERDAAAQGAGEAAAHAERAVAECNAAWTEKWKARELQWREVVAALRAREAPPPPPPAAAAAAAAAAPSPSQPASGGSVSSTTVLPTPANRRSPWAAQQSTCAGAPSCSAAQAGEGAGSGAASSKKVMHTRPPSQEEASSGAWGQNATHSTVRSWHASVREGGGGIFSAATAFCTLPLGYLLPRAVAAAACAFCERLGSKRRCATP